MNGVQLAERPSLGRQTALGLPSLCPGAMDLDRARTRPAPRRRVTALVAIVGGLATTITAAAALAFTLTGADHVSADSAPVTDPEPARTRSDVGMADNTYVPGHSSGWHVHPGVHSVVVLAGTLTIYDRDCLRHDYGPGQSYLGGGEPHLARNETPANVDIVVTYVYEPSSPMGHGVVVTAPAGCEAR